VGLIARLVRNGTATLLEGKQYFRNRWYRSQRRSLRRVQSNVPPKDIEPRSDARLRCGSEIPKAVIGPEYWIETRKLIQGL
jgi:hypothetical protein